VSLCFGTLSPGVLVSACAGDDNLTPTCTAIAIAISISFLAPSLLSISYWAEQPPSKYRLPLPCSVAAVGGDLAVWHLPTKEGATCFDDMIAVRTT
jgi:hypothetical protein